MSARSWRGSAALSTHLKDSRHSLAYRGDPQARIYRERRFPTSAGGARPTRSTRLAPSLTHLFDPHRRPVMAKPVEVITIADSDDDSGPGASGSVGGAPKARAADGSGARRKRKADKKGKGKQLEPVDLTIDSVGAFISDGARLPRRWGA